MTKRVLVIYHFFYPDDVVSSRHLSDLAVCLAQRGWDVTALTSNRFCRDPRASIPVTEELWRGVRIHRVSRPAFRQSSNAGRLVNTLWLVVRWLIFIARERPFDAVILGSDPQFGYIILPIIRLLKPHTKLFYWGFDLYPEAIVANNMGFSSRFAGMLRPLTRFCYARINGMVDIGPCMRQRLDSYHHHATCATLVPWALAEPKTPLIPDADVRRELFGDARLGLLYSGTIGKAHQFEGFITLARELRRRNAPISICFAGHGNRYNELRSMVAEDDTNITFAGFAEESQLERRLSAGDIHMLSLRPGWEGVVVPSKFFGSLAAGRPVLYEGTMLSSIKTWIDQFQVGYALDHDNVSIIADELCRLADNPALLRAMQKRAHACYQKNFSRESVIDGWNKLIAGTLNIL